MAAVHVPSKAIGFILGHRGASIQALTEKTGAQLRVAPASEITTGSSEHRVRGGEGGNCVGDCAGGDLYVVEKSLCTVPQSVVSVTNGVVFL